MPKQETPEPQVSDAIALRRSSDVAALDELDSILRTWKAPEGEVTEDPDAAFRQIIAELLDAKDDDDLEFVGNAESWRELEGIPIQIQGFRWRPSDEAYRNKGPGIYFVVFGERMDDGSRVVLTCGSGGVMAQLSNLARRGRIPGAVRMIEKAERPTHGGFYPLRLVSTEAEIQERRDARKASAE